jgi:hypothetical protein
MRLGVSQVPTRARATRTDNAEHGKVVANGVVALAQRLAQLPAAQSVSLAKLDSEVVELQARRTCQWPLEVLLPKQKVRADDLANLYIIQLAVQQPAVDCAVVLRAAAWRGVAQFEQAECVSSRRSIIGVPSNAPGC